MKVRVKVAGGVVLDHAVESVKLPVVGFAMDVQVVVKVAVRTAARHHVVNLV